MYNKFVSIIGELEELQLSEEARIEVNYALRHLVKAQMMYAAQQSVQKRAPDVAKRRARALEAAKQLEGSRPNFPD